MFNSFFSCCLSIFSHKEDFKKSSLNIKSNLERQYLENQNKVAEDKKYLSHPKIRVKTKNLNFFSKHIIEDIISPIYVNLNDFIIEQTIGKGSFGEVFLVNNMQSNKKFAMKVIRKTDFLLSNQLDRAILEKNIMKYGEHPFLVKLRFSFQTKHKLFLIMDYLEGGDIYEYLKKSNKFNQKVAKFYAIEVILALEYLHENLHIVYRDLKPENILVDCEGHIKLSDFGLSKSNEKSYTLCGTPQYVAPEILLNSGHSNPVDIWSFGCFLFELLTGRPPFNSRNTNLLFRQILEDEPIYPNCISTEAKNLIQSCLKKNSFERITLTQIKNHEFFQGIIWDDYLKKKYNSPIADIKIKFIKQNSEKTSDNLKNGQKISSIKEKTMTYKNIHYKKEMNSSVETDDEETF